MYQQRVTARMSQAEKSNGALQSIKVGNYTSVPVVGIEPAHVVMVSTLFLLGSCSIIRGIN